MNDLDTAIEAFRSDTLRTLARLHQRPELSRYVLPLLSTGTLMALSAFRVTRIDREEESPLGREYENLVLTAFGEQLAAKAAERYPIPRIILGEEAKAHFKEVIENRGLLPEGR